MRRLVKSGIVAGNSRATFTGSHSAMTEQARGRNDRTLMKGFFSNILCFR